MRPILFILLAFFAGSASAFAQDGSDPLTPEQYLRVQQISSVFENSTIEFQYDYIEDIGDGAGVTLGRIGFITTTHGVYNLIQRYVDALRVVGRTTPLEAYLPCLDSLYNAQDQYGCLFPTAVRKGILGTKAFKERKLKKLDFGKEYVQAAYDPIMQKLQDQIVRERIYQPTLEWTQKLGLKTALGFAIIFDTILQQGIHGINQLEGMVARAGPMQNGDEVAWLKSFLLSRRQTQKRWFNDDGTPRDQDNDYVSYPRSDSLMEVLESGNLDLMKPVKFKYFKKNFQF